MVPGDFCIDYMALNSIIVKGKFPISSIDEIFDKLQGAMFSSKLDLGTRYHYIPIKEKGIYETAFQAHLGHFELVVMSFRLTNALSTF